MGANKRILFALIRSLSAAALPIGAFFGKIEPRRIHSWFTKV